MELQVISTGSRGNAYVLRAGDSALLLDAGVPIGSIREAVGDWETLCGCLITHEHGDHTRSAMEIARRAVPVYMSKLTSSETKSNNLLPYRICEAEKHFYVGPFMVYPIETRHDVKEPLGYIIRHEPTGETLLYATDTWYLKRTYPGVHYWVIECSYMDELIDQQRDDGDITAAFRHRLKTSHMSLRRLLDTLRANDLSKTRAIVLVHLSDERSDEKAMVEAVRRETGIENVYAAEDGMQIPLELCPF